MLFEGACRKGQLKVSNFRTSDNKLRYGYVLTPRGDLANAKLTQDFLKRRMAEHEALRDEIEALRQELRAETVEQGTLRR